MISWNLGFETVYVVEEGLVLSVWDCLDLLSRCFVLHLLSQFCHRKDFLGRIWLWRVAVVRPQDLARALWAARSLCLLIQCQHLLYQLSVLCQTCASASSLGALWPYLN